jgi:hypothetical protein
MSDIVERLNRGVDTNSPPDITDRLMAEAADEIERLRHALKLYGDHAFECELRENKDCSCGYEKACE